ncbi:hypothetical protein ACVW0J_004324 [Bradyrhizobium sp. i1.7.7]
MSSNVRQCFSAQGFSIATSSIGWSNRPFGHDRNREPFDAIGGLDPVAVVPVPLHILHTIVDHVFVALADEVEEAPPGDVAGLDD